MSERIDEIRERVEKLRVSPMLQIAAGHVHPDYTYLLERIDTLTKELHTQSDCLKRAIDKELELQHRIGELERENERLRRECITWQEMAHSLIPNE